MAELPREQEPWLADIVERLRRPVSLSPEVDAIVAGAIARGEAPILPKEDVRTPPAFRAAGSRWRRPMLLASGLVAAALVGLVFISRTPRSGGASPGRRATTTVEFTLNLPASHAVSVVGDFNNWDPAATPMRRHAAGSQWSVRVPLNPGRYRYVYLVDGARWLPDPRVPRAPDDDYGAPSSVVTVAGEQS